MSQWLHISKARLWRTCTLGGLAGAMLFAAPAFAENADGGAIDADVITETPVASQASVVPAIHDRCAPVSLASTGAIAPAAAPYHSKAAAILGGAPSSLDRIRMAQTGAVLPAPTPAPALSALPNTIAIDLSNPAAIQAAMAPASAPSMVCNMMPSAIPKSPGAADDGMILGSVRLSIRRTPFDQQWGKISSNRHPQGLKHWLVRTGAATKESPYQKVEAINGWVNTKITYTDDAKLYRQNDYWASSRETLRRRKGDCEDYAILKMDLLAAMGIDRDRMILVVARDLVRNADHAVLVVQLDDGPVILDNSTDQLLDGRLSHDYRPIMSFASNGKWLHGYALAAAEPVLAPVATLTALSVPSVPVIALSTPVLASN
jgi:predicted transglutaminase-like cysteine proteinase